MERVANLPEFVERDATSPTYANDPGKDIEHTTISCPPNGFHSITDEAIQKALNEMNDSIALLQDEDAQDEDGSSILTDTNHRLDWWQVVQDGYVFPSLLTWIPFFRIPAYDWKLVGSLDKLAELLANQTPENPVRGLAVSIFMIDE